MGFGSGSGGSGSTSVSGASDVTLSNPLNSDVLTYDSSITKWKNAASVTQNDLAQRVPQQLSGQPGRFRGMYTSLPSTLPSATVGDWIIVYEAGN